MRVERVTFTHTEDSDEGVEKTVYNGTTHVHSLLNVKAIFCSIDKTDDTHKQNYKERQVRETKRVTQRVRERKKRGTKREREYRERVQRNR